ncbi:IS30 family transposase [Brucella pseudogrignonensis]|uniref:IS30 family transposase n=1 Tax=Brucella pseudogrignonensis TaxID=419475 RepID=A0ABU1MBT9_9HYPH|nr:IS30 family transposase [Brucella pseudogrignonensis]MDR6433522.1 IS30 family transposase [Brucella pseudogrignonensis]
MDRTYSHIDLDERRRIARWRTAKLSVDVIAERLGRHRSTIFRELKRNQFTDDEIEDLNGYYCTIADQKCRERRSKQRKLIRYDHLRQSVIQHISDGWSPQQIAGRMRLERHPISVSHETIYQFVYSTDGRQEGLWKYLPERRAKRRPRHARRHHGRRFPPELSILHRPDIVARRKQFGHWECDLIQFRKRFGKANVTSLVERVSRFTVLLRNNDRQSRPVMDGVIRVLQLLPQTARRSITFDRGTEFTEWSYLQNGIGSQTWFCDPNSPWQKGAIENINKRIRRYLPSNTDLTQVSQAQLTALAHDLNATPRKCLGFKTPAEAFATLLREAA